MQITVTFDSLGELKDFADQITASKKEINRGDAPQQEPKTVTQAAPPVYTHNAAVTPQPTTQAPASDSAAIATPPAVPTTTPTYTADDLAKAAITLMDAGRQQDLLELLRKFGVEALPQLPQAQYGAFATALRGLGAKI